MFFINLEIYSRKSYKYFSTTKLWWDSFHFLFRKTFPFIFFVCWLRNFIYQCQLTCSTIISSSSQFIKKFYKMFRFTANIETIIDNGFRLFCSLCWNLNILTVENVPMRDLFQTIMFECARKSSKVDLIFTFLRT